MIVAEGLTFPEGPAIDADGRLYCCNLAGGTVGAIQPDGEPVPVLRCNRPNGLTIHPADGSFWIADSGSRAILRWRPGGRAVPVIQGSLLGPNDLLFSPDGVLYFTDPVGSNAGEPIGRLFRYEPSGRLTCLRADLAFPNGLALTPDGQALILAETLRHRLLRIDLATGAAEPFAEVGKGPDGMALAPDGRLYVALYREGVVAVMDLQGRPLGRIVVQDPHPTNCLVHKGHLFVTLAWTGRIERLPCDGQAL